LKALRFAKTGDLANLSLAELPQPQPGAGEVLVRIKAAGVNKSDVSNVMGGHPYTTLPRTPGRDFAGLIERGPQALVGRAVWGTGNAIGFTRDGSHAEFVVLPSDAVASKPQQLSFEEAASCGVPYITAWHALETIVPPARLLVIGGAGAVGMAAMQLARRKGLQPVAAVRSAEQATSVKARGFEAIVLDPAVPGEWDAILDTTGHWLAAAIGALAHFGRVVVIFAPGDGRPQVPVRELSRRGASIVGINSLAYKPADCARLLSELAPAFESGELGPPDGIIARPLSQAIESYAALQRGQRGKLVLVP
jgi:NADPH:quinone reductase-like Zn-dependent oxidoreductase